MHVWIGMNMLKATREHKQKKKVALVMILGSET